MKICGIDPGITTGYCLIEYFMETKTFAILEIGELRDEPEAVARYLSSLPADFWAIESFSLSRIHAVEVSHNDPTLITVQIIGALKALIPVGRAFFQTPATKSATPDPVLKSKGVWHRSLHSRDSIRHALFFTRGLLNENAPRTKSIKGLAEAYYKEKSENTSEPEEK